MSTSQVTPAVDRLFRAYEAYCQSWNEDSLFNLLNALHSLEDRLKEHHGRVLLQLSEFVALKALRNYLHHQGEVKSVVHMKPLADKVMYTDLVYACLVSKADCIAAVDGTVERYRASTQEAVAATFRDWGDVVDVNPCIFNCVVKAFEALSRLAETGDSLEYSEFAKQYAWETESGHSHYVSGLVLLHPGDVDGYFVFMKKLYMGEI